MSEAFVADASVAIAWVHPSQATNDTRRLLESIREGATVHVPALWYLEVANALLMLVRRQKLTDEERLTALGWLQQLPCATDYEASGLAFGRLSELASEHTLSVYDAAYLELAQRRSLPLACREGPLRRAAQTSGVEAR